MPRHTLVGEQWDTCDICGIKFPLSRLILDEGLRVCDHPGCRDLEGPKNESHAKLVAKHLDYPHREGEDRRDDIYFRPEEDDNGNDI